MLSHRTKRAEEYAAYDRMWVRFGSWEAIQNAPIDDLVETLSPVRYPEKKAPDIQAALATIYAQQGTYAIDFLADLPTADALHWLMSLRGVGIKTASLVLLFAFEKPVMPVDTHVYRVTKRLGLIGQKTNADQAHTRLLEILPSEPYRLFNFHVNMMRHGQRVCHYNNPACIRCPLQGLCDDYKRRNKSARPN